MIWTRKLVALGACEDAVEWARTQSDLQTAWDNCERADWMLWLLARLHEDRKSVVWLACQCARTSLKYVPKGEKRPRVAIEMTERWCRGEASIEDVRAAAADAYAAAVYDAAAAAADAVYAAADAADAAAAAAADAAADAVYAAADAADAAAAAAAAARRAHIAMARIIRRSVPDPNDVSGVTFTRSRRKAC
jgi:nucleoid-associated protein YgaU